MGGCGGQLVARLAAAAAAALTAVAATRVCELLLDFGAQVVCACGVVQ